VDRAGQWRDERVVDVRKGRYTALGVVVALIGIFLLVQARRVRGRARR
jgi:hypothetical protein